jgi:hypothetical protein
MVQRRGHNEDGLRDDKGGSGRVNVAAEQVPVKHRALRVIGWNGTRLLRGGSLAVAAVALVVAAWLGEPQAVAIAAPGLIIGLALIRLSFRGSERQFLVTLFLVAFALRVVGAVTSHFLLVYRGTGGFVLMDDRAYDKLGWGLTRVWTGDLPGIRDTDEYLMVNYTYLVAGVYYVLGHSLLAAKMLNVAFGSMLAVVIFAIGAEILGQRAARVAALLTAFFPSLVAWSVINLKDILVVLLTATAVLFLLRYARRHQWRSLLLALLACLTIENLRQFVFFILVVLMPVAFLFADRSNMRRRLMFLIPLLIGVATITYATHNERFGRYLSPKALTEAEWKRWLEENKAQTGLDEFGGVRPPKEMDTIYQRSIAYLPRGIFYVLFGPTPWEARSGPARAVIPEMLLWYGILAAGLAGIISVFRGSWRDLVLPLGFAASWMAALALTEGNTGNIFRHRSQFMPFVFLVSAAGLVWAWKLWQQRRLVERGPA